MADVDLIPDDYRRDAKLKRFTKPFLLIVACAILLAASGRGLLSFAVGLEKKRTSTLEAGEALIREQRILLEKLRAQQADLQQRLVVLNSLRNGPAAAKIFQILDRAVNHSVWFTSLRFIRTGKELPTPAANRDSGFRPAGSPADRAQTGAGQRQLRMEINGQALNHSDLADLVKKLLDQQEVQDVHIVNTSTLQYPAGQVTAYSLVVTIRQGTGGKQS